MYPPLVREEGGSYGTAHCILRRLEIGARRCPVRFRDDKPGDLDRARAAAAAWREQHPEGTPEDLIAAVGCRFRPDYAVVLRGVLFAVDRNRARQLAGIVTSQARAGQ
jgi:hypothetical protein